MKPLEAEASAKAFPWDEVMALGFGLLRLSPDAFWSMTPREIASAMVARVGTTQGPPKRRDLDGLMMAFPDGG